MNKPKKKAESNVDLKKQQLDETSEIYINLLCDRYKNRGVSTKVQADAKAQTKNDAERTVKPQGVPGVDMPEDGESYQSGSYMGVSYMTSDDFAKYYKERREFNAPHPPMRDKAEYDEIEKKDKEKRAEANSVSPKKAKWLAVKYELKTRAKKIKSKLNAEGFKEISGEWFPPDEVENRREGKKSRFPKKSIPAFVIITLSLFLIVSGSVMVSHAEIEVSKLENKIIRYERERDELDSKLQTGTDLWAIREWALGEGMVSREYLNSKYIELENDEITEKFEKNNEDGIFKTFLKAIGLINDEK